MTESVLRTPLRPLSRILPARARGENTDQIEKDNIRKRHEQDRERARARAQGRIIGWSNFCLPLWRDRLPSGRLVILRSKRAACLYSRVVNR